MVRSKLVFHLPKWYVTGEGKLDPNSSLFGRLLNEFQARGGGVETKTREDETLLEFVEKDRNFHFVSHGNLPHPRILNVGKAYLNNYWNCDEIGIRARSGIYKQRFNPSEIEKSDANKFFRKLKRKFVEKRRSKFDTGGEEPVELPKDCITILLQPASHGIGDFMGYLDQQEMVEAVIEAVKERPIILKPHPADEEQKTEDLLKTVVEQHKNVGVFRGNIHDLLAVSSVTVSINSGAALEGYLHHVPTVLCGRCDFRHRAEIVKTSVEMEGAIQKAIEKSPPYEKYLYWYFVTQCLDIKSETFLDDVLARIASTGFDISQFGLDS